MKRGLVIFIIVLIVIVLLGVVLINLFKSKQIGEESRLGPVVAGGVVKGATVFDGRIMKVTQITNSSAGISNDQVEFTDFETKEVYKAILTSEGIGTVSVKGLSYNVKYFRSTSSFLEDRFVIVSSFDGIREQRVFYNAYVLFFAKDGPVPTVYCGNGIKDRGEQCDDGNKVSGDGCSSVCTLEQAGAGGGRILKVTIITNQTGTSNNKVELTDFKTGNVYSAIITADGAGTINIGGKSYTIRYFGISSSDDNYIEIESASFGPYLAFYKSFVVFPELKSSCIDSDKGKNATVFGIVNVTNSTGKFSYKDSCLSVSDLSELFCSPNNQTNSTIIKCPKKCSAGACKL